MLMPALHGPHGHLRMNKNFKLDFEFSSINLRLEPSMLEEFPNIPSLCKINSFILAKKQFWELLVTVVKDRLVEVFSYFGCPGVAT